MRKYVFAVVLAVSVVVVGGGMLNAQTPSTYHKLTSLDRAARASKESGTEITLGEPVLPGNLDKADSSFKKLSELPQHTPASALREGAVRLEEKRVSYAQIVDELQEANPQIHPDRQIWAVTTYFPNGVETRRGKIENAIVSEYWDAETGEFLFFHVRQKP